MLKTVRRLLRFLAGLALLAGLLFVSAFVVVLLTAQVDERRPCDAIVVLGAAHYNGRPSPVFQARLDHALKLYREKLAPRVVVTGGQARGDNESEAAVGRRYLPGRLTFCGGTCARSRGGHRTRKALFDCLSGRLDRADSSRPVNLYFPTKRRHLAASLLLFAHFS